MKDEPIVYGIVEQVTDQLETNKDVTNNSKLLHLLNPSTSDEETENVKNVTLDDDCEGEETAKVKLRTERVKKVNHDFDIKKVGKNNDLVQIF